MDKNVRFIFKALIGTATFIVVSALVIEFLNISLMSLQMQQLIKLSVKQACTLFSQETYKLREDGRSGSYNASDIMNCDGNLYLSGTFYSGTNAGDIYSKLYNLQGTDINNEFKAFVNNTVKDDHGNYNWYNIGLIVRYMLTLEGKAGGFSVTEPPNINNYVDNLEAYEEVMEKYSEYSLAKSYVETYVTPLNFGVPYLDRKTVTNMFRWNLARILSNCNSEAIVYDEGNSEYYVSYSGYKVYASEAKITSLQYSVFDLTDSEMKADFQRITHINPDKLSFSGDIKYLGKSGEERNKVCVIGIEYSVPVGYEGVTWLSPLIGWVSQMHVDGEDTNGIPQGGNLAGGQVDGGNFSQKSNLTGGGLLGDGAAGDGLLAVPGKLIYYVVR